MLPPSLCLRLLIACMPGPGLLACEIVQYQNPPPLFLGQDVVQCPLECIAISNTGRMDIGAFEYVPPMQTPALGDSTLDHRVDIDDCLWCLFCWNGPHAAYVTHITRKATREPVSVSCWLCDLDGDEDVDLADFAELTAGRG